MVYPSNMLESAQKVIATRNARAQQRIPFLTPEGKKQILQDYHPDFRVNASRKLVVGPSKGESTAPEVADILEAPSALPERNTLNLENPDYKVDVLVIGAGGGGCTAALHAHDQGASVLIATKLRMGDSNTIMAEGGIAAATHPDDSPTYHYLDTMRGGRYTNNPALVEALVKDAPEIIDWLMKIGVGFGRNPDGTFQTHGSAGHSYKRSHAWSDMTGLEVMRVLRDEIRNRDIEVLEFRPAIELLLDEKGNCAGAILKNLDTGEYQIVEAKAVILATGGIGRLHIHGFPTTNHYGATGDGLVLAYRAGAKIVFMDAIQFHPTGTVWPEQLYGLLVSESTRANGAQLCNIDGERFINELETRDTVASAIIRECGERGKGVQTPSGTKGVWLDLPTIDTLSFKGRFEKRFPHIYNRFKLYGIDASVYPVFIHPTQHYQNGGIAMNEYCECDVPNLFLAGEVGGGLHGRNRLGSNSLIDVFVFGRRAGTIVGEKVKEIESPRKLTLNHVEKFEKELTLLGIEKKQSSPMILPDYTVKKTY